MRILRNIPLRLMRNFSLQKMNPENCTIAVCQFTATNNKQQNLQTVKRLVASAASQKAKVVFLPEGCDYIGSNKDETKALSEPLNGYLMNEYKTLAVAHDVWLSIGGFHECLNANSAQTKFRNAHVLINNSGEIEAIYRKLHLFDVSIPEKNILLKESDMVSSGTEIVRPIMTPAGPLALSICYDLRFPELSIILRQLGASILTYPSAFTSVTGQAHWETLLRARAIETQCYVVAAAQFGRHNSLRTSHGQSMIVDPWGKIVAACPTYLGCAVESDESVAVAVVSHDLIKKVREEMPVFEHRRSDIYSLQEIVPVIMKFREHYMFADKVIPSSTVFYATGMSYAFTNIRCVVPGHVLVASIRPAHRLEDLTRSEISDLFQTVVEVQKCVEKAYEAPSSTICVQDGKYAGQTVAHIHVHILPRKPGDFDINDEIYDKLAKHDKNEDQPMRSLEEMSEEAAMLREQMEKMEISSSLPYLVFGQAPKASRRSVTYCNDSRQTATHNNQHRRLFG